MRIWAAAEDVVLVFGGPRTGKTAWLAIAAIFAAGAVVMTSTRLDLIKLTRKWREMRGLPTWVFNPGGLGDLPSDITFEPTHGCDDPAVAVERAADMIPVKEDDRGESASWDTRAQEVYAAFLHAAGLSHGTRDSHDILRWSANPELAAEELQLLLQDSRVPSFASAVEQFIGLAPQTRSSIVNSIMPALKWLNSESAVAATKGGNRFDVGELIRARGTVYMLGRHEAHTAPLLAALNGYIAREARRLAALQRDGRLDPPLGLHLDEAARVSPVPLPDWSGDAGGSGIQLICAFQSLADVRERWGTNGAAKVLNNAGSVMLFGGTKDPVDLEAWAKLAGDRDEPVKTRNGDGKVTSTSSRKAPVLAPAKLSNLPAKRVVVYTRGMDPVVGRAPRVWERRVQRAARRLARVSRLATTHPVARPLSAPAPTPVASPTPVGAAPGRELTDVAH
jgi:type IV secretory pathway TraG/TraD family ATPase VirD4